jgi:asparagine synthase (glutamine-hydrolysing)
LRDYLNDMFADGARLYEYVDRAAVRTLVEEHQATRADRSARLWTLLTLEVWLRSLAALPAQAQGETREARIHH